MLKPDFSYILRFRQTTRDVRQNAWLMHGTKISRVVSGHLEINCGNEVLTLHSPNHEHVPTSALMDEFPVDLDDEPSPLSICELCRSPALREDFWVAFRVRVCESCARTNGSRGQSYGLITKSDAQVT